MTDRNEALVREAYEAYGRGDVARMMEFVDPELEWTYLNPAFENPGPETCHGRDQLQWALERRAEQGLRHRSRRSCPAATKVMVVICTPGIDRVRVRQAEDRNYLVLTLDQERITRMRACRNRALAAACCAQGRSRHAALLLGTAHTARESASAHMRPGRPPDEELRRSLHGRWAPLPSTPPTARASDCPRRRRCRPPPPTSATARGLLLHDSSSAPPERRCGAGAPCLHGMSRRRHGQGR